MPFLVLVVVSGVAGLVQGLTISRSPVRLLPAAAAGFVRPVPSGTNVGRLQRWIAACAHPTTAASLALCLAVAISVAGWFLLGALTFLVRSNGSLLDLDSSVAHWGSAHATELSTRALNGVTKLGDTRVVVGLGALLLIAEAYRGFSARIMFLLVAVVVGNELTTTAVKHLMHRARPALNPVAETLGPSFPSGHSSTAAAFYAAAAIVLARRHGHIAFTALTSVAVTIAVAVASSRVFLDVHWLSDVVAGLAVGWAWATLCVVVLGGSIFTFEWSAKSGRSDDALSGVSTSP
jgi:undecaprenyl-diphosphatase